jgi:hypothetical protein
MSLERATAALSSADMAQPIFGKLQSFRRDNVAAVLCALAGLVGGVDYNRRLWVVVIQLVLVVVGSLGTGGTGGGQKDSLLLLLLPQGGGR